jgi:putative ABC transport system substrate-binding protein
MSTYRKAAQQLGIDLVAKELPEVNDMRLRRAYEEMAKQHFDAAVVDEDGAFLAQRALPVELAAKHLLPVIYPYRDYVELGGLIAYGPDFSELAQRLASDVH